MDIGKAFTYMFQDPNWIVKLVIGGGILFVGTLLSFLLGIPLLIAIILVLGYTLSVTRSVAEGIDTPLPQWNDFGALFMKGLLAFIGEIILYLPAILLTCCMYVLLAATGNGTSTSGSSTNASSAASIISVCVNCLIGLYSLVAAIVIPAATTRYAMTENQLSIFWDIRGHLNFISQNVGNYIIALLLSWVAGLISALGLIACGIGIFWTGFWAMLVSAFLYGQVWRSQASAPIAPMGTVPS